MEQRGAHEATICWFCFYSFFLNGDGFYGDMNGKISGVCEISVGYSCYVI